MSSSIMLCIISLILSILSIYNAIKCDKYLKEIKKYGRTQKAKIISYQKRKSPTSTSGRYTMITWYDITVKIEMSNGYVFTRTISTTNIRAYKYRKKTYADIVIVLLQENPPRIDKIYIIEDLKSSLETFFSIILFIIFSLLFIISIVGLFV